MTNLTMINEAAEVQLNEYSVTEFVDILQHHISNFMLSIPLNGYGLNGLALVYWHNGVQFIAVMLGRDENNWWVAENFTSDELIAWLETNEDSPEIGKYEDFEQIIAMLRYRMRELFDNRSKFPKQLTSIEMFYDWLLEQIAVRQASHERTAQKARLS